MTFTDQDSKSIIERQKKEMEALTQSVNTLRAEQQVRVRALEHVREAIEEAISMASRVAAVPVAPADEKSRKHRAEALALQAYFKKALRNFDSVLEGYPINEIAERPVSDERAGDNSRQGA